MPEGDTIHRISRALAGELVGRELDRLTLRDQGDVVELAGRRVDGVDAMGKHLLIHLDGGWSVRVHLGMHGKVTRRHVREAPPTRPTAVLVSGDTLYAVERAFTAETVRTAALRTHPKLARLGPDLAAGAASGSGSYSGSGVVVEADGRVEEAVRRASVAAYREREIGDLLLDQRVAAGIGNVFKSEVLFECRVDPQRRVGEMSREELTKLFATAARQLRGNMTTRRRTTVPLRRRPRPSSERLWVYGRVGKPCLECGAPIQRFLQGDMARSTYFCPGCQRST
jgi:endonuclease VIII